MSSIILCNISDAHQIIEEEKMSWTYKVLEYLGVPKEIRSILDIDEYRQKIEEFGIEVIFVTDGEVKIYKKIWHNDERPEQCGWLPTTEECLVAHWKIPTSVMKIDDKRNAYYEIHTNEWSIMNTRK